MSETDILPVRVQNVLDMEIVRLNLWSIKFNATNIKLEGFVRNEEGTMMQKVCSEYIVKRMNAALLFDVSGRFFELSGQIDREFQLKNGMPGRIIDEFQQGFPENWAFLIQQCLTNEQRSVLRPIQAAPAPSLREKAEKAAEKERERGPIVTLADETELCGAKNQRKEEEDAANNTFRAPKTFDGSAITPIRYIRGSSKIPVAQRVFEATPVRSSTVTTAPLASSTPQAPPKNAEPKNRPTFASDADLFAVPKLPKNVNLPPLVAQKTSTSSTSTSSSTRNNGDLDILDEMDALFDNATIDRTPSRAPPRAQSVRRRSPLPPMPRERERYDSMDSRRYEYDERRRGSRIDDDSRMARKRGYERSPDRRDSRDSRDYRRYEDDRDDYRSRDRRYYESDRYDSKRYRPRETSSSSGRSVRFEEEYRSRNQREERGNRREEEYERKKLKEIERRERELAERLAQSRGARRDQTSSDEQEDSADDTMGEEWERENQEILDNSMMIGAGGASRGARKQRAKSAPKAEKKAPAPKKKPAQPRKKEAKEQPDLNDSIAANRPRRACATPATPAPKKITWPRRELDKLKRVIELKKPSGNEADWVEVARLLAKEGVEPKDVRAIAETKLKWKEPTVDPIEVEKEEEEERKRRKGVAAKVRENVQMREEMRNGEAREELEHQVEQVEDYQPADVSADESLLAIGTPQATKKKGGTRKSTLPVPVEDSPIVRGNNSSIMASPKLDSTKAKDVETTLRYVQHLSTKAKGANTSMMNSSRGGASTSMSTKNKKNNTSMSLEQGTRKAMRMVNRAMDIEEEEEEDEEEDEEEED